MAAAPGKTKLQSRSEKRKKRNEQLKKTTKQNFFNWGLFVKQRKMNLIVPLGTPSTSVIATTPLMPIEVRSASLDQTSPGQDKETVMLVHADCVDLKERRVENEIQLLHQSADRLGIEYQYDVCLRQNITNKVQNVWCTRDANEYQYLVGNFFTSTQQFDSNNTKFFTRLFCRKHVIEGKSKGEWLKYSPSTGNIYCFPCFLFEAQIKSHFKTGFSYSKNASQRTKQHQNSATPGGH